MDDLTRKLASLRPRVTLEWGPAQIDRAYRSLARERQRRRLRQLTAVLSAAACVSFLGYWALRPPVGTPESSVAPIEDVPPLTAAEITPPAAPVVEAVQATLSDGSVVVAANGGELEIVRDEPARIELRLAAGRATFDVVPNLHRAFIVRANAVEIVVVGTAFEVAIERDRVWIEVSHGKVRVRAPGAEAFVRAGETAWFKSSERRRRP